ncbi:MAG: DUF4422 domain-containing protein [Lactobacillaceae bacterium]|jgi:hypothetical protein|nr:DUF4422 domain-containing protein [Lactobacillaceae bacterium]
MNVKILVAAHKEYPMPSDLNLYLPIFVGADNFQGSIPPHDQLDNQGKNISKLNPFYNELTAQYWAWKNLKKVDAIGLAHYRRHFAVNGKKGLENVLTQEQVESLLTRYDVILPTKRKYYIESNYDHYIHAHKKEPLDLAAEYIKDKYPNYVPALEEVFAATSGHYFNMFIMKKEPFNDYSKWLFEILEAVYKKIDYSDYDDYEKRSLGFVSELLLDVWVKTNPVTYTEVPFVFEEKQDWLKKGSSFLLRKIKGDKK